MQRGFTLIETMLVISILGIVAALAVPALTPLRFRAESYGAAQSVADFIARAQTTAMTERRCTRVFISTPGPRTVLQMDRMNTFDCGDSTELPSTAARIDGSVPGAGNLWIRVAQLTLDSSEVSFLQVPTETAAANYPDTVAVQDEIRFRSSGRLYSNDADISDDDAVLELASPSLPAGDEIQILVESFGPICIAKRGVVIPNVAGDYSCP